MPRFVTRGCVICQPQWSVLGRHMSSVIRSISASSPYSLVTDLRCWRWFLELSQCQWFQRSLGSNEFQTMNRAVVEPAWWLQPFTISCNIFKAKYCRLWRTCTCCLLFICLLFLDVAMWWIFEKNTRGIENHFGTVTLALEEPNSFFQYHLDFVSFHGLWF